MWTDARRIERGIQLDTDVLIIGAGAAGLAIASQLGAAGFDVLVAESGGKRRSKAARRLVLGRNIGPEPFNTGGRRRVLGGGMTGWGGNCSLLDAADFEPLLATGDAGPQEPLLEWPISPAELSQRAQRAAALLGVVPDSEIGELQDTSRNLALSPAWVQAAPNFTAKAYLRADRTKMHTEIGQWLSAPTTQARLLTHATCLRFELDDAESSVRRVDFVAMSGQVFHVRARQIVVASGPENAPLLLQGLYPNPEQTIRRWPALGRYLHSHLLSLQGFATIDKSAAAQRLVREFSLPFSYGRDIFGGPRRFKGLQLLAARRQAEGLLNGVVFLAPIFRGHPLIGTDALADAHRVQRLPFWHHVIAQAILGAALPPQVIGLRHFIEQVPRWGSYVTLGRRQNALGQAEPVYHWQAGAAERNTIARQSELAAQMLCASGFGQLHAHHAQESTSPDFTRNAHPMGGTVMGSNAGTSVVDANLRLHGLQNLYICGGSVLPRGGAAMLTGVIVQLALRLADHLATEAR